MAKIYAPPKGFSPPSLAGFDYDTDTYFDACDKYVGAIKRCIKQSYGKTCPEAGKEIVFPVGDGKARYIVVRLKPVELIHVDIGDAYHFEYVNRLTASDVRKEIKKVEGLRSLFRKKGQQ